MQRAGRMLQRCVSVPVQCRDSKKAIERRIARHVATLVQDHDPVPARHYREIPRLRRRKVHLAQPVFELSATPRVALHQLVDSLGIGQGSGARLGVRPPEGRTLALVEALQREIARCR